MRSIPSYWTQQGSNSCFFSHPVAGKARKNAVHVGREKIARASLAIGLPNVPDHYWEASGDADETAAPAFQRHTSGSLARAPQEGSSRWLLINKDSRPPHWKGRRDATCPLYPLNQPHESCDDRDDQEQENGLQDALHPRFLVDLISHRSPHFGTSISVLLRQRRAASRPPRRGKTG